MRAKGTLYHIHHPFHIAMNSGQCTKPQIQGWVYNRFYYQISIPVKDASILANMPDRDQRRQWILRVIDHDGTESRLCETSGESCGFGPVRCGFGWSGPVCIAAG